MAFNIDTFHSTIKNNNYITKPNLFHFQIYPSNNDNKAEVSNTIYLVQAAAIPSTSISEVPVSYFGRTYYYPGTRSFEPLTITVLNDEDFGLRDYIFTIMNRYNNIETNVSGIESNTIDSISCKLTAYGAVGNTTGNNTTSPTPISTYSFVGCYFYNLSEMDLSWDANDQVQTFTVDIRYRYYTQLNNPESLGTPETPAPAGAGTPAAG